MRYRWKSDPWWTESPGQPFRMAALGVAIGLPALLFTALVRNALVHPAAPINPVDAIVKTMNGDPDREARQRAIRELWNSDDKGPVIAALTSGRPEVHSDVADFLAEQGDEAFAILIPMLFDPRSRATVTSLFIRMGPKAADRLIAELPKQDGESATTFVGVLGEMGPAVAAQSVPAIRLVLRSGDRVSRMTAAEVLGSLGPAAHAAIPDLIAALNDADPGVRLQCMQTLGRFGAAAGIAVPAIAKSLRDPLVANAAAGTLGAIGAAAVDSLTAALDDPSPVVRLASAQALGKIGPPAHRAMDRLKQLAKSDADFKLRQAATTALAAIGLKAGS